MQPSHGAKAIGEPSRKSCTRWSISATYWEQDPSFSPAINESIRRVQAEIPDAERIIVKESWDLDKIQSVMAKWSVHVYYQCEHVGPRHPLYLAEPQYIQRIGAKAMAAHPSAALRVFVSTLYGFLTDQSAYRVDMYSEVPFMANQMYVEGTAKNRFVSREFFAWPAIRGLEVATDPAGKRTIVLNHQELRGRGLYLFMRGLCAYAFDRRPWTLLYLIVFALSAVRVIQTRMRHWGAFIVFMTCSCLLGAALLLAGVAAVGNRYAVPTKFIEVLSVGLAPLLWRKEAGE